jgi:hypothetical protein
MVVVLGPFLGAEQSVGNQFAGGDVGGAQKGARSGGWGRRRARPVHRPGHAAAQAGQEAAGLVVGQATSGQSASSTSGLQQRGVARLRQAGSASSVTAPAPRPARRCRCGAARQVRAAAQRGADVLGQRADVGALAAAHVDHQHSASASRRCRWRES